MLAAETEKCFERKAQSHTPLHSASNSHEIQRQQQVGETRKFEVVVKTKNENLLLAFQKAKKRKSKKAYVQAFEANLKNELYKLQWELSTGTYAPRACKTEHIRMEWLC